MINVNFWEVISGHRREYTFKISRVPCVGESIFIDGHPVKIKTVVHVPYSESNATAAICYIE